MSDDDKSCSSKIVKKNSLNFISRIAVAAKAAKHSLAAAGDEPVFLFASECFID